MKPDLDKIYVGDCLEIMHSWPDTFVQTIVTSPPYWGLRDYGVPGQIGLEETPEAYVETIVQVFRDARRILRDDGTLWLNLGDTYAGSGKGQWGGTCHDPKNNKTKGRHLRPPNIPPGLKPKDQCGIPWRVAFALQSDGWYLRSDIIWAKPNPMPESVQDRPTKSHEYLFLLAKSEQYFYDADAIKEPAIYCVDERPYGKYKVPHGWDISNGPHDKKLGRYKSLPSGQSNIRITRDKQRGYPDRRHQGFNERWDAMERVEQCSGMRNKRSVWMVGTFAFPEAHFATYPPQLIKPCILAATRPGDIVFDPFMGAGTTAWVAATYCRRYLGIELNPEYVAMAERRVAAEVAQVKMAI